MGVHLVYEGSSDLPFLERFVNYAGGEVSYRFNQKGVRNLDNKISDYLRAASTSSGDVWLVVRDSDGECPVELRKGLLDRSAMAGSVPDNFLLRIAHPMIEEWMLADFSGAAAFFRIPVNHVRKAQSDPDPKRSLLQRVLKYSTKQMRQRFVRGNGTPGPEFVAVYREFAEKWDVEKAIANSDSLRRAYVALRDAGISSGS